jgi:hypothetical protein
MSSKGVFVLLILVVAGVGVGIWISSQQSQQAANAAPIPLPPAEPPDDEPVLEPGTSPFMVVGSVAGMKPGQRDAMIQQPVGCWIPPIGWGGDVTRISQRAGGTSMSLMVVKEAAAIGSVLLFVEAPGDATDIQVGDHATVSGRIKDIRLAGNPLVGAHQIYIELARVKEVARKPR